MIKRALLSGNEAVAQAALDEGVRLGVGYPGTPSTEILENFSLLGGRAQWSPNEKVALEVGLGSAFAGARTLVTMKHVGLNVAADPLFTAAYTGVSGGLVLVVADDPGMASSQNEQDSRRYGIAAGVPVLEPGDSQEAYDLCRLGLRLSEQFGTLVLLRVTTRVCHSKTIVQTREPETGPAEPSFTRDIPARVMIPAYARAAHRKLRQRLHDMQALNEASGPNQRIDGKPELGIISTGICTRHAVEAAPEASHLQLAFTYPLPMKTIRDFVGSVKRCVVVEEGDPVLAESLRAEGLTVEDKPEAFRFGELNVDRVRRILAKDTSPEPVPARGKPPQLCLGCPHRMVFETLRDLGCTVTGDIGCYTLGVLPPFEAMDTCVCMGASIGVGLGMRHVLPEEQARRVVSVIGDSTFVHSGVTGLIEMVYSPPPTGHLVLILDNSTTAMTGLQEHPGTGRKLDHSPAQQQVVFEDLIRGIGISDVTVVDPGPDRQGFAEMIRAKLESGGLSVVIVRRPCILAVKQRADLQQQSEGGAQA